MDEEEKPEEVSEEETGDVEEEKPVETTDETSDEETKPEGEAEE